MKEVLVVVAHPDDETIWMGGTLLKNSGNWHTTIISLCRSNDTDRAPKFLKVCSIFNSKCCISDLEDEKLNPVHVDDVIRRIKKFSNKNYDYIFTHGGNGEYGHNRHIDVNKAVNKMLSKELLSAEKVFFFSYIKKGEFCYPNKNSNIFTKLEKSIFEQKKDIINKLYGFKKDSFEYVSCRDTEAFRVIDLK